MKAHRFLGLLCIGLFCLISFRPASAATLVGSVVDVIDGDTFTVNVSNRPIKVRLCALTVPKKTQPFAEPARLHLALLLKGKQVSIEYKGLDRDGTIIGIVMVNDLDVGMQMIRDGAALFNRESEKDLPDQSRSLYEQSQQAARSEARGIWQNALASRELPLEPLDLPNPESLAKSTNTQAKKLTAESYSLIWQGNYSAAMPRVREALRLDPKLAEAHRMLAIIYGAREHYEQALTEVEEAIRLKPDVPEAHNDLGIILFWMGNYERSIRACNEALRLNPRYAKAQFNVGVALMAQRDFKKALAAFYKAELFLTTQDGLAVKAATQVNIGLMLHFLGKTEEARQRWKKVLTMGDPGAAMLAEINLGNLP